MSIPSSPSFIKVADSAGELIGNYLAKQIQLGQGLTNISKVTKLTNNRVTKSIKTANDIKKKAESAKNITDALKKGKYSKVSPQFGRAIGFALQLASIGLSLLTINQVGFLQEVQLRKEGVVQKDLNIAFTNFVRNGIRINKLRQDYNNFVIQYKLDKDKLGANITANLQNLVTTRELSEAAKKQANDALYEAREGRKKVDARVSKLFNNLQSLTSNVASQNTELADRVEVARKLGNDALYEARANRQKLEVQISENFTAARKLANDALYEARANRQKLEANFGQQLNSLKSNLDLQINSIESKTRRQVDDLFKSSNGIINNALSQAKLARNDAKLAQTESNGLRQQINRIKSDITKLNFKNPELNIEPTVNRLIANSPQIQGLLAALKAANVKLNGYDIQIPLNTKAVQNVATNVQIVDGRITKLERGVEIKGLNVINARIAGTESAINNSKIEIDKLKKDNIDRGKLNDSQYNNLLQKIGLIPLLIAKVPNQTIQRMPRPLTTPQIEAAASAGVCRSTSSGGCMSNALNNNANQINANTNNWGKNLLNKFNAGANGAQLALLKVIDGKLGSKIANGGLSGAFRNIFQNKLVDRAIAMTTLMGTLHNGLMLSNSLTTTLFSATDNILNVVGIKIKDEKGADIGIKQVVDSLTLNFANTLFGAENVKTLNTNFKKANRIYQAGANIANSVRSMTDSLRNITEFAAENTGKIGNALKKFGVIGEKAFPTMPENVNGASVWVQRLQNLEDAAQGIEMVTSEAVSIKQNLDELTKQKQDFEKSIEDLPSKTRTPNLPVKTLEDESKTVSSSPAISDSDKIKPNT